MTTTTPPLPRPWSIPAPNYVPVDVTPPELLAEGITASIAEGWAEPSLDPTQIDFAPRQAVALLPYEVVDGRPRNPAGRTGKTGRNLGLWGENAAADPIVIADTPTGPHVLLIRRSDCGQWAIPGGMVDPGETAPAALVRELREETGVDLRHLEPEILARTYIHDPRNSDEAWVCSTVALHHLPNAVTATAGDDATHARWWPLNDLNELRHALDQAGAELYEAHAPLLTKTLQAV
jgi:ADP-ribose pyrophosphatase YjhB (NUDIX family)